MLKPDMLVRASMSSPPDNVPPATVHCPECGYDLRALPEHRCPECGFHYDSEGILALNVAWCLEVLDDLRFAAAVQAVGSGIVIVYDLLQLRRSGGIPCVDLCIAPFLAVFLLLALAVGSIGVSDAWRRVTEAAGRVAWVLVALFLLGLATVYEARLPFVWMLFPVPGLVLGLLALQKSRSGHDLNRDSDSRIHRRLRPWMYGNLVLVVLSAVTALTAGVMALL
jgi:hypothetical protein